MHLFLYSASLWCHSTWLEFLNCIDTLSILLSQVVNDRAWDNSIASLWWLDISQDLLAFRNYYFGYYANYSERWNEADWMEVLRSDLVPLLRIRYQWTITCGFIITELYFVWIGFKTDSSMGRVGNHLFFEPQCQIFGSSWSFKLFC